MLTNAFEAGLERNPANHVPLSPLSFLKRAAFVYPRRTSVVHGAVRHTWSQTYERCCRLASALARSGIASGDTVAVMLPNTPAMFEAHFGVPMSGAVLNALNTRLDARTVAFMLDHSEARVLLTDCEFADTVEQALSLMTGPRPLVIDVPDELLSYGRFLGATVYEEFLLQGNPNFNWQLPEDEWNAIALNYTSGTTGNPKGVVTHHRGAYLNGVSNVLTWNMPPHPTYLWTLPMFHCNGWCFPWTLALQAGTSICLRKVEAQSIFKLIRDHRVSHLCGAPIVFAMLVDAPSDVRDGIAHTVAGLIAGAAPPAAIIEGCERIGIDLTHVYGLTEVYGPAAVCAKQDDWSGKPTHERAKLNARQGVPYPCRKRWLS
jgi:fatty-acyl-CoA synthase